MSDDHREVPGPGDPAIAEEARGQPARQPQPAQESRRRRWLLLLAVGVAIVGPFANEMSGLSLPIALGSCGLAGFLVAFIDRGLLGALIALALALIWVAVGMGLVLSRGPYSGFASLEADAAIAFLIMAASAEVGYLVGCLVVGVVRRLMSAVATR